MYGEERLTGKNFGNEVLCKNLKKKGDAITSKTSQEQLGNFVECTLVGLF